MHPPVVYVVDDDPRVRDSLSDLLASHGLRVAAFASAAEFVRAPRQDAPACLILDVRLPDMDGLELQRHLADSRHPPIVFISGHGDILLSVRAMKAGAIDFLPKPFSPDQLLAAIDAALARDCRAREAHAELDTLRARYASLTPREREVLPLVADGLLNKQAAAVLGISLVTLQIHRGSIMRKMGAASLANLVRMAAKLDIPIAQRRGENSELEG
jgi:FixJ family two-component response regulator